MNELKPCPLCGEESIRIQLHHNHFQCCCNNCNSRSAAYITEAKAIQAWNTRADGWISVEDRLPPKRVPVLVDTQDFPYYQVAIYMPDDKWEWHIPIMFETEKCIFELVTHWQPLPEPPENEDEEK